MNSDVRKPLRARKTMTPSSRRQIEVINKVKERAETASSNASSEDKDGITNSDVKRFLNAGALQDVLYSWYENESSSLLNKPVEVHLNVKLAGRTSDHSEKQSSVSSPAGNPPALSMVTNIEEMVDNETVPVLEQEDTSLQLGEKNTTSFMPDDPQRRRRMSRNSEETFCKRVRTSDGARKDCPESSDKRQPGLEKVQGFIQEQLAASMQTLDHQLQQLNERVDHTHCLRKHEGIAIKIVKKISRLERRINGVIASQVNLPGAHSQSRILNKPGSLPDKTSSKSLPSREVPSNPSKTPPGTVERSDDVVCLDEVKENSSSQAVNPPDAQPKEPSAGTEAPAAPPCTSKNSLVIDLTDEESNPSKDKEAERKVARRSDSAAENQTPSPLQPLLQSSREVPEDFSHLPPLPKIPLHPEPANGFQGTLPPQKVELSMVRVKNPKGIALKWNIQNVDPRCAPIDSFHLFLYLEGSKKGWGKTSEIPALPLPMACSLTDFPSSTKCYFIMQAKDIYGRYGPFCDIQSILAE